MSWINSVSNKDIESVKYALNYELDDNEKKLISLSNNHDYLIDWITKPFDKFGYAEELKSVRKYYRMNNLQENDFTKIAAILNWNLKGLSLKQRFKYFYENIVKVKDKQIITSFLSYSFSIVLFSIVLNIDKIKTLSLFSNIGFILAILMFSAFVSISGLFLFSMVSFYKKAIFFEVYGNEEDQEQIKNRALKIIMETSGVYKKFDEELQKDNDFLSSIEKLSQKFQEKEIKDMRVLNKNKFINFCEEVYNQCNLFSKVDYSYDELLQKNKEKLIVEQKDLLEKSLLKNTTTIKNKAMKV